MTVSPSSVLTIGETMALARADGPLDTNGATLTLGVGGSESNVAIGLSRLGHTCTWVTALGGDSFGNLVASTVAAEGVEVHDRRSTQAGTGLMVRGPTTGSTRDVAYFRAQSAASTLDPSILQDVDWTGVGLLHLTGITAALSPTTRDLVTTALADARSQDITTSFDVNYREKLWSTEQARSFLTTIVGQLDIVFGDAAELALLVSADVPSESVVDALLTQGVDEVVLRDGARGARCITAIEEVSSPALPINVVDTVGAGDAFVAGYLSARLEGEPLAARGQRGVICGGLACTAQGDWEGSPTRDQVHEVLLGVDQ